MIGKHDKRWLMCANCFADDVIYWSSSRNIIKAAFEKKDTFRSGKIWRSPCNVNANECPYGIKKYRYNVLLREKGNNCTDIVSPVRNASPFTTCQDVVCAALNKKDAIMIAKHLCDNPRLRNSASQTKEAQRFAKEKGLEIYHDNHRLEKDTYSIFNNFFQSKKTKSINQLTSVSYPNAYSRVKRTPHNLKSTMADYDLNGMLIRTIRFKDISRLQVGVHQFYLLEQFGVIDKMNKENFNRTLHFLYDEAKRLIERFELDGKIIFYGDKKLLYFLDENNKIIYPSHPQYTLENALFADYATLSSMAALISW
jgi:hypothetical protein